MKGGDNEASSYLDSLKSKSTDYNNSHNHVQLPVRHGPERSWTSSRSRVKTSGPVATTHPNASDSVVDATKRSMDEVGLALNNLGKSAQNYGQHMRDSINKNVGSGSSTLQWWQDSISSLIKFTAPKNAKAEHDSNAADGVSNKALEASEKLKPADKTPTLMERATNTVSSTLD
ncbi:hypothetical protein PHMEG_0004215 [Phytophthora megakarya]|uniref:Uncharacterized protein n=1 Tax=Phytophthora megakarya TaxID=4795 RepID=A0A225WUE0_9STRA|nr:hypothetical protein PHMEG_0004215 [Phytophthora megakarya]